MYATVTTAGPGAGRAELWDTREQAAAAGGPVWEVVDDLEGPSAGPAAAVQLAWFDAPRSPEQQAADRRAGRERLWPALRDLDGLVHVLVLTGEDGAMLVLTSATAPEVLERAVERIMSTELLPGEDPALLGGPDRVEVVRLTAPVGAP